MEECEEKECQEKSVQALTQTAQSKAGYLFGYK